MQNPSGTAADLHKISESRPVMTDLLRVAVPVALLLCSFGLLYFHVVVKLVHDFATDDNASHGFLIVPLALYLAWERRGQLARLPRQPSLFGLLIVLGSVGVLAAGTLGSELFLARISMLGVLAGTIVFMSGWAHLRTLAFPIAFLLLMIPLPAIIFNQIALPLQLLASRV
jgi:exosortase